MSRILGVDLGSYSVKGVLLDSSVRAAPVQGYLEVMRPLEGSDPLETLRAALTELRASVPDPVDQVYVSLPGASLATHTPSLPFTDAKRIEAALPFELESQLPFDNLSEVVFDYQPTTREELKSDLVVSMVRREELAGLLELLASVGFDPRGVLHPALAYHALWLSSPATFTGDGAPFAVVDIGHERTSVAIGLPSGDLGFARTFAGGGKDLTRALAAELQISWAQANHWKENQASLSGEGADNERVTAAMIRGLQPLLRELRPSLKAFTARTRQTVGRVYLCGGTSQLPGLDEQLARDLGVPTQVLSLPLDAQADNPSQQALPAAQPYALALRGTLSGARAPRFNLRRQEFAFKGDFDYLKGRLGQVGIYTAVIVALFICYGMVRGSMLSRREAAVDQQLCEVTTRVLGHCEKSYDRALNLLKGKESSVAAVPKISATTLLAEMTQRIPSDVSVTFDQILVDPDRLSVRGTTGQTKLVDRLSQAFKSFKCFHDVKVGKLEKTKDEHVNFRLDVQVECPDHPPAPAAG